MKREENFAHMFNNSVEDIIALNITKEYCDGKKVALYDLSFHVSAGECLGLLGGFGAGKTTLLRILCASNDITSGNAYIEGIDVSSDLEALQNITAYCPSNIFLLEEFTVLENLNMFLDIRGMRREIKSKFIKELSQYIGISEYLKFQIRSLKKGIQKKVCLAIVLLNCPRVLLLDEPTLDLDPVDRLSIWDLIRKYYQSQRTVIIGSKNIAECECLCSRVAILVQGEFRGIGSVQKIKNKFSFGLIIKIEMKLTHIKRNVHGVTQQPTNRSESLESILLESEDKSRLYEYIRSIYSSVRVRLANFFNFILFSNISVFISENVMIDI